MAISGTLIAENQIDSNKIIEKLSPPTPRFSRIINTHGETCTLISHPEGPLEGELGQAQEEPLSSLQILESQEYPRVSAVS